VEEQQRGRVDRPGLSVKYLEPMDIGLAVMSLGHERFPDLLYPSGCHTFRYGRSRRIQLNIT